MEDHLIFKIILCDDGWMELEWRNDEGRLFSHRENVDKLFLMNIPDDVRQMMHGTVSIFNRVEKSIPEEKNGKN